MKIFSYIGCATLMLMALQACQKDKIENPGQYSKVFIAQAIDMPVQKDFIMADTLQTLQFGAAFGGVVDQTQDITLSFKVDPALVDSFNKMNGSNYPVMPAGSYELLTNQASIAAGAYNTGNVGVSIKTVGGIQPLTSYLLPISIDQVTPNIPVNEDLRTAYVLIRGTDEDFDRSAWSIADVSSVEPTNPVTNVLDGNVNTWWFTQWRAALPPPPHHIVIDMGASKNIHGVYIIPLKQASGNPKDIEVLVSEDNVQWTSAAQITLTNDPVRQDVQFDQPVKGRYFKIVINNSYGGKLFTYISEIGAF
ncbi:MAG TPA: DUF1735 domain-containing protein [Chitinophagaceae bacterium]|nr:DUF1735 domain-containing protein [Chitinophagaceae bacterium]